MSLFGALNTGVTGLTVFSNGIATNATNIANINTTGYKSFKTEYSALIAGGTKLSAGGGVIDIERTTISQQGVLQATNSPSDLAISGNGFFVVGAEDTDGTITNTKYSRSGAFILDKDGNYVNAAGDKLFGWPLDSNGNRPGEGTNTNTTPSQLLDSLVSVNILGVVGQANPTTDITAVYNLDATTVAFLGATDEVALVSGANSSNGGSDLIVPSGFNSGDDFSLVVSSGTTATFTYTISDSNDITTTVLGASTADTAFTANDGDTFTITVGGVDNVFTYQSTAPDEDQLEFSTLNNLRDAINQTNNLIARVSSNRLYIADVDGSAVSFTNGSGAAFVTALGFTGGHAAGWSTLDNLEALIDAHSSSETYAEYDSSGNLEIGVIDPTATFTFTDDTSDAMLTELGLDSIGTTIGPAYAAGTTATNMASGNVTPDFSGAVRIFDAQGAPHDLLISFLKTEANEWAYEIYSVDSTEVTATDGLVTSGTVRFDGAGVLTSSTGLTDIPISWTGGASDSEIDIALTGTTQLAGPFVTNEVTQNGLAVGDLAGTQISDTGRVTAFFSNGTQRELFQIPLAIFPNPDGLETGSGGVFQPTDDSGAVVLEEAGQRGAGKVLESTLEGSNADIAQEFTKMIIAQRGYQANTRIIRTADDLLEELTNLV